MSKKKIKVKKEVQKQVQKEVQKQVQKEAAPKIDVVVSPPLPILKIKVPLLPLQ